MTRKDANRILVKLGIDAGLATPEQERRQAAGQNRERRTIAERVILLIEHHWDTASARCDDLTLRERYALNAASRHAGITF